MQITLLSHEWHDKRVYARVPGGVDEAIVRVQRDDQLWLKSPGVRVHWTLDLAPQERIRFWLDK